MLGMRRLNAHGESKRGGLRDGSAFKQLTGFILTDALEQRKKTKHERHERRAPTARQGVRSDQPEARCCCA